MRWSKSVCILLLLVSLPAMDPASAQPNADAWRLRIESGVLHRGRADIDAGGAVERDAWSVRLGADRVLTPDLRLGLSLGYDERDYRFHGATGFGALEPWSDVRELSLNGRLSWKASERWNLFAVPTLRWFAEEGADLDDGQIGGLIAAASYRVNERLSIGPGFGVFSALEDTTDWFPILAIDWQLTDTLALRTGGGFAATQGPGLVLNWRPTERWAVTLGARYEKARFRLDDRGIAVGGIGQETSVPVYLGATHTFGTQLSLSVIAGVEFAGELRLEEADGDLIDKNHYDPAPFGGATLDLRF